MKAYIPANTEDHYRFAFIKYSSRSARLARTTYILLRRTRFAPARVHARSHNATLRSRTPIQFGNVRPRGVVVWQWPCRRPASGESNLRLFHAVVQEDAVTSRANPHYKQNRSYRL